MSFSTLDGGIDISPEKRMQVDSMFEQLSEIGKDQVPLLTVGGPSPLLVLLKSGPLSSARSAARELFDSAGSSASGQPPDIWQLRGQLRVFREVPAGPA